MARVATPKFGEWVGSNTLTRQEGYSARFAQRRADHCRATFPESETAPAAPARFTVPREPSPTTRRPADYSSSTIKLVTSGTSPSLASIRRRHRNVAATMPASTAAAALAAVRAARESSGGASDGKGNEFCSSEVIINGKRGGAGRGGRIRAVDLFARQAVEESTATKHDSASAGFVDQSTASTGSKSKLTTKAGARGSVKSGSLRGSYRGGGAGRSKPKSLKEYEAQLLLLAERLRLDDSPEDEQAAAAAAARLLLAAGRMGDPEAKLRLAAAVLASPTPDGVSVAETVAGSVGDDEEREAVEEDEEETEGGDEEEEGEEGEDEEEDKEKEMKEPAAAAAAARPPIPPRLAHKLPTIPALPDSPAGRRATAAAAVAAAAASKLVPFRPSSPRSSTGLSHPPHFPKSSSLNNALPLPPARLLSTLSTHLVNAAAALSRAFSSLTDRHSHQHQHQHHRTLVASSSTDATAIAAPAATVSHASLTGSSANSAHDPIPNIETALASIISTPEITQNEATSKGCVLHAIPSEEECPSEATIGSKSSNPLEGSSDSSRNLIPNSSSSISSAATTRTITSGPLTMIVGCRAGKASVGASSIPTGAPGQASSLGRLNWLRNWRGNMGIKLKSRASVISVGVSARNSIGGKPGVGARSGRVAPSAVETRIAAEVEELVAAAQLAVEAVEVVEAEAEKAGEEAGEVGDKQEGEAVKESQGRASGEEDGSEENPKQLLSLDDELVVAASAENVEASVAGAEAGSLEVNGAAELKTDNKIGRTSTGSAPGSPVATSPRGKVAMARAAARALLAAAGAALVAGSATKERVGRRWEQQRHAIGHAAYAVLRRRQPENSIAKAEDHGKRLGTGGLEELRQNDKAAIEVKDAELVRVKKEQVDIKEELNLVNSAHIEAQTACVEYENRSKELTELVENLRQQISEQEGRLSEMDSESSTMKATINELNGVIEKMEQE
ncbi:unnamed protein product [Closterium sp. NIES-64]|nr:unnamed protein product [Closterium sp. NIES-64]